MTHVSGNKIQWSVKTTPSVHILPEKEIKGFATIKTITECLTQNLFLLFRFSKIVTWAFGTHVARANRSGRGGINLSTTQLEALFTLDVCVCVNVTVKSLTLHQWWRKCKRNVDVENGFRPIPCINVCTDIDTILNCDGDANADVKCEQALTWWLQHFYTTPKLVKLFTG